jgi:hypothetical protein
MRAHGSARRRLTGDRRATSPRLSPTQRQVAYVDTSRSPNGASPYLTTGDMGRLLSSIGVYPVTLPPQPLMFTSTVMEH